VYQIRVPVDAPAIEVTLTGCVPAGEALRAISQAGALASAGGLGRALCDLRGVQQGPERDAFPVIEAALRDALQPGRRAALLCRDEQLGLLRRLVRGAGGEIGVFTRVDDARSWLAGRPVQRLSGAARRHLEAAPAPGRGDEAQIRGVSSKAG